MRGPIPKPEMHNQATHPVDLKLDAMLKVLDGTVPIIAHADRAEQIQSAVAFCRRNNLRLIIYGGYDAESCARLLRENHVPSYYQQCLPIAAAAF